MFLCETHRSGYFEYSPNYFVEIICSMSNIICLVSICLAITFYPSGYACANCKSRCAREAAMQARSQGRLLT